MSSTDTTDTTSSGGGATRAAASSAGERCGQCGAPATHDQRYCVRCGFHRRNAPDPVSRYLSEASAARAAVAAAAAATGRRRVRRLSLRTVTMLVALALVVGILIGSATSTSTPARRTAPARTGGASATHGHSGKKLKRATGSNYVNQENNLPNTVTP